MPSSVVDQETETRRASIRQACALELDQEMAKLRARKQSELEKSIDELSTEMMDDIERRAVARVAEVDRQIADREKQGLADLERALGGKRAELQTEVSELEDRRCLISMEIATLEKGWDAIKAELQTLSEQQNHATETVERWTSVASALGTGADSVAVARRGEKQCSSYLGRFAPCLGNELPAPKHRTDGPRSRIARTQGNRLRFGLLLCVSENILHPAPLGRLGAGLLRRGKIRLREKCTVRARPLLRRQLVLKRWSGAASGAEESHCSANLSLAAPLARLPARLCYDEEGTGETQEVSADYS